MYFLHEHNSEGAVLSAQCVVPGSTPVLKSGCQGGGSCEERVTPSSASFMFAQDTSEL